MTMIYPQDWLQSKRQTVTIINVAQDMGKLESSYTAGGNGAATLEDNLAVP